MLFFRSVRCLYASIFVKFLRYIDVKSRIDEKFQIFSNFLAHPVETP